MENEQGGGGVSELERTRMVLKKMNVFFFLPSFFFSRGSNHFLLNDKRNPLFSKESNPTLFLLVFSLSKKNKRRLSFARRVSAICSSRSATASAHAACFCAAISFRKEKADHRIPMDVGGRCVFH